MKTPAIFSAVLGFVLAASMFTTTAAWGGTNNPAQNGAGKTVELPSPSPKLSHSAVEIVHLTQAGIDESVVFAFIENLGVFDLGADHIVYLNDLGVSGRVIQAMLMHDRDMFARLSHSTSTTNTSITAQKESAMAPTERSPQASVSPSLVAVASTESIAGTSPQIPNVTTEVQIDATAEPVAPKQNSLAFKDANKSPTAQAKRKVVYPVREPYPVELTAPIVFLDAPSF